MHKKLDIDEPLVAEATIGRPKCLDFIYFRDIWACLFRNIVGGQCPPLQRLSESYDFFETLTKACPLGQAFAFHTNHDYRLMFFLFVTQNGRHTETSAYKVPSESLPACL